MRYVQALILLCVAGWADAATTIYRCGPGGKEYSQRPCVDGIVVEGTDGRTAAQRAGAAKIIEQEKRKAAELERERRAEEKKAKPANATGIDGLARPADDAASANERGSTKKKSGTAKSKDEKVFVAVEPITKAKK